VAYLFDVDDKHSARIITHEPITQKVTPGQDVTLEWELQAAAYDVPANHRLMLVIDSTDPLYRKAGEEGKQSTISISSPKHAPACLALPLG